MIGRVPRGDDRLRLVVLPAGSWAIAWSQAQTTSAAAPRWIPDRLPAVLRGMGPQGLAWWQWLAVPVLVVVALGIGRLFGALTQSLLLRVFRRTPSTVDERWLASVAPALTALWATAVGRALLPWLELPPDTHGVGASLISAAAVVAVFWLLWRSIDTLVALVVERSWAAGDASARSTIIVGGNLLKAAVLATGAVTTAATFGYPVATVIAGLGIGGIAFAFGAQKTVEHLFGSIALAADQPCRVGDVIKVEDVVGQVERIGTRSTRIRTPDRTLVTIPNGRLADSRIESYTARDRLRLATVITLAYGTTESQVRQVLGGIDAVLRAHPLVWPDVVVARLANLGATTIDIEIMCWFETSDFEAFRSARQEVLLGIMRVVEDGDVRFANVPPPAPPAPVQVQPQR
jgi:MscS family membrane protein